MTGQKHVVIAGGGVAALEAVLALRSRAGERVALTLVAPQAEFTYRPLSVREPFALGSALSVPLSRVARDFGVELVGDALESVDVDRHEARLANGETLGYDALLVAIGARRAPAFEHVVTFRGQEDSESVHGLIQDLEGGYVRRVAFVVPAATSWPLPIYELALMAAERAYDMNLDVELTVVSPEPSPLRIFGAQASDDVAALLDAAGVAFEGSTSADVPGLGTVVLHPHGRVLECDRVVALARVLPIHVDGLPRDRDGFIPADRHGRAQGATDVYAAGDGISFPVKQGGLACQQADAAADSIARWAGASLEPQPFQPVLRGQLLTGKRPWFMEKDISGTAGDAFDSRAETLWWPPGKIAGEYIEPYLHELNPHSQQPPAPAADSKEHDLELLGADQAHSP